jgi:D-hydroxyproline dehydrogenase subunit gamma
MTAVRLHAGGRLVEVTVDGKPMRLPEGEPLATALACEGVRLLRRGPRGGAPRGAFCFMGACQECAIHVDGALRLACITPVKTGMAIERRGAL